MRTIEVRHGNPENHILIQPPLTDEELHGMIEAGVITERMVATVVEGAELGTVVAFGRLVMGAHAMDEATERLAQDIGSHLGDASVVPAGLSPNPTRLRVAV